MLEIWALRERAHRVAFHADGFGRRRRQHWGGDCESTFEAMAETLRGGLSLTSSGFAFASHDIGGFEVRGGFSC